VTDAPAISERDPRVDPAERDLVELASGCLRRVLSRSGDTIRFTVGDCAGGYAFSTTLTSWRVLCLGGRVLRATHQPDLFRGDS